MQDVKTHVVYEFVTDNSRSLQDVAGWCNKRSEQGWEFVALVTEDERFVALFKRPKPR